MGQGTGAAGGLAVVLVFQHHLRPASTPVSHTENILGRLSTVLTASGLSGNQEGSTSQTHDCADSPMAGAPGNLKCLPHPLPQLFEKQLRQEVRGCPGHSELRLPYPSDSRSPHSWPHTMHLPQRRGFHVGPSGTGWLPGSLLSFRGSFPGLHNHVLFEWPCMSLSPYGWRLFADAGRGRSGGQNTGVN